MSEVGPSIETPPQSVKPITLKEAEMKADPERAKTTRINEVKKVARTAVFQVANAANELSQNELAACKTDDEREQLKNRTGSMIFLRNILNVPQEYKGSGIPLTGSLKANSGNDLYISISADGKYFPCSKNDSNGFRLISIMGASAGKFSCIVEDGRGNRQPMDFDRNMVYDAQLLSEETNILANFEENDPRQAVLENHIARLKNPSASLPDKADDLILAAAEKTGQFTMADLVSCTEKMGQQEEYPQGASEEQKRAIDLQNTAKKRVSEGLATIITDRVQETGAKLADLDTLKAFAQVTGVEKTDLSGDIQNLKEQIGKLQEKITRGYGTREDLDKIEDAKATLDVIEKVQISFTEAKGTVGLVDGAVEAVDSGDIPVDIAVKSKNALREGKPEAIPELFNQAIEKDIESTKTLTAKQKELLRQHRERIKRIKSIGGIMAAFMGMYVWQGLKKSKQDMMGGQQGYQ